MSGPSRDPLGELEHSLLEGRPRALRSDEGDVAFAEHKLLTTYIHRASRLHKSSADNETSAWVRYFVDFFPEGKNGEADARLLFSDWRTSLLKDDAPGPRVPITHGKSVLHWQRDHDGRLCINLENMWDDYAASVQKFIAILGSDPARRECVLGRWKRWSVTEFVPSNVGALMGATVIDISMMQTSAAHSITGANLKPTS